jgi:plasmid replication initiation protein
MEQEVILFQETNKFNKPNIMINIVKSKELTTKDKKVYNILLRQLLGQELKDYQTNMIKTTITQICRELNIKNRNDIHSILDKLEDTRIEFLHLIDNEEYQTKTRLITSNSIHKKNEDSVVIEFSQHITNELLKHYNLYTKLDLIEMNKLSKTHSLTLYELFKSKLFKYPYQYQNYSEKELREILSLNDKYSLFKDFNRYVIKDSIKDINDNTNINIYLLSFKKDKHTNERIFKFYIEQDKSYTLSFTRFKNIIKNLAISKNNIKYKIKSQIYELSKTLEGGDKILWWNYKSLKIISNDLAKKIWEQMFQEYNKGPLDFLEKLKIDIEDFIEYDYKTKE